MTGARTALFLSAHLDDVAFSCGGLVALLADAGWRTVIATVFTHSVVPAQGFALACQLDKGLGPDVDYMALRRAEDLRAASHLGAGHVEWLDLLEAPHRGYGSAAELFGALRPDDAAGKELVPALVALDDTYQPDLVLAPQALGRHVDHQIVAASARTAFEPARLAFYRDTPYALREPRAVPVAPASGGAWSSVDITRGLARKIAASSAYATQIGFQFGGGGTLAAALTAFALQEGEGARAAERFLGCAIPVRPDPAPGS